MLVFKSLESLQDHVRNYLAGKRIWAAGTRLPEPHEAYPTITRRGVTTQFLLKSYVIYTNEAIDLADCLGGLIGETKRSGPEILAQQQQYMIHAGHELYAASGIDIMIAPLAYPMRLSFTDVIYDPREYIEAEDGERLTSEQCKTQHLIFRCSQQIYDPSGSLREIIPPSPDTPIYCPIRGWKLQIARETHPEFNSTYDAFYVPTCVNKITQTREVLTSSPTCCKCGSICCQVTYRIGSASATNYMCGACAYSLPIFESLSAIACPEVPLKSPRDLLLNPAKIEQHGDLRILVTATPKATYIGVRTLKEYLTATSMEGLPYPTPVIYAYI